MRVTKTFSHWPFSYLDNHLQTSKSVFQEKSILVSRIFLWINEGEVREKRFLRVTCEKLVIIFKISRSKWWQIIQGRMLVQKMEDETKLCLSVICLLSCYLGSFYNTFLSTYIHSVVYHCIYWWLLSFTTSFLSPHNID